MRSTGRICLILRCPETFEPLIDGKTKALFVESLGNPQGNITDFERIAEIAHRHGVPLIVDNTVPTPYLCQPIKYGATSKNTTRWPGSIIPASRITPITHW